MNRHSGLRATSAVALILASTLAQAANQNVRNALVLPNETVKCVAIALPQENIGVKALTVTYSMAGPVVYAADGTGNKHFKPALDLANQSAPTSFIREEIARSARANLDRSQFTNIGSIELLPPKAAVPTRPSPDCLYLSFEVYFVGHLSSFQIAMHATVPGVSGTGNKSSRFAQDLFYAVPAEGLGWKVMPKEGGQYWQNQDPAVIRRNIAQGVDELIAMLNREVTRQPVKGRIPGPQVAWNEGHTADYGVVLDRVGDRVWLRLRSGRLASIPTPND